VDDSLGFAEVAGAGINVTLELCTYFYPPGAISMYV